MPTCIRFANTMTLFALSILGAILAGRLLAADDQPPAERLASAPLRADPRADSAPTTPPAGGHIEGGQTNGRWREGSRMIDMSGSFRHAGDRVTFLSADGKLKLDCLENLCMERVARMIGDSPDVLQWTASGTITECAGTNYLLLSQAMLKAQLSRQPRLP
jgi:hypothetical protein